MTAVAIIADDLTGAADAAAQFSDCVSPVSLCDLDRPASLQLKPIQGVSSVFTSSRALAPESAARRAAAAAGLFAPHAPRAVFKKIDSSLRGNIGAECDAVLDAFGMAASYICAAFPEQGRTTIDDIHCRHGIPVAQTELGHDPVTPVTESRLSVRVASQSRYKVASIGLELLEGTQTEAHRSIREAIASGSRHLTFDATTPEHLDRIVSIAAEADCEGGLLLVGSAGLARSLARSLTESVVARRPVALKHPILWVCGSASDRLREQTDRLREKTLCASCDMPADLLLRGKEDRKYEALVREGARALAAGDDLLLRIGAGDAPAEQVLAGLTQAVVRLVAHRRPETIFLSGGDTARSIMSAIQADEIRVQEESVPGIVTGTIVGGMMDGRQIMTKPGSFGEPDALTELLAREARNNP